ncbi:hypothetical protein EGW08_005512, partial [Elysia chlorotica]
YRDQDKPSDCESSAGGDCGRSSDGSSSIICLPTLLGGSTVTVPSREASDAILLMTQPLSERSEPGAESSGPVAGNACEMPRPGREEPGRNCRHSSNDEGMARSAVPLSDPTPLNLAKAPSSPLVDVFSPETTPLIQLSASSLPKSTPMVPLEASAQPKSTPMIPLSASALPKSTPLIPLEASTPVVSLEASTLPKSTPMVALTASIPPESASAQVCHTVPMMPLEDSTPAVLEVAPSADVAHDYEALQDTDTEVDQARDRRDSDSDFVVENCSSSEEEDDDDDEDDDNDDAGRHGKGRNGTIDITWESDSSDDFCIIDPENIALIPEGFELLPDVSQRVSAF